MLNIEKKSCLLTIFSIPSDLFISREKMAMILYNPAENYPFLVVKTRAFARGLSPCFYIITMKKMENMIDLTKSLFINLDGFNEKLIRSAKLHQMNFELVSFSKTLEVMAKILKLFFASVDMTMIMRQMK